MKLNVSTDNKSALLLVLSAQVGVVKDALEEMEQVKHGFNLLNV